MKTIEDMAREAGCITMIYQTNPPRTAGWQFLPEGLARFAAMVRAQALEEAAVICERDAQNIEQFRDASSDCAAAIRAAAQGEKL